MATTRNGKTGGEPGKGKATGGDASAAAARPVTQPRQKATGQKVSKERGSSTRKKNPGKRPRQGGS